MQFHLLMVYFVPCDLLLCMRRSRYDIFRDILYACTKEQNLTSILRKCGLSSRHRRYLVQLNHCGFLKKQNGFYKTTNEGRSFLREFEVLLESLFDKRTRAHLNINNNV
jgi:predicted transcriptional regulator